jgi:condensin-2 complex subunit H2
MQYPAPDERRNLSNADSNGISFLDLLRPVRDLAANWNVDVVSSLSEYLTELGMDQSVVQEISNLRVDFKQAALLVEGSTSIYSRKVDYLYTLVFATADMVNEARGKKPLSRKAAGNDAEDSDDLAHMPHWEDMEFLLLDDLLDQQRAQPGSISLPPRAQGDCLDTMHSRDIARIIPVPLHLLPSGPPNSRTNSTAFAANMAGLRFPQAAVDSSTGALILDGIGLNWTGVLPNEGALPVSTSNDISSARQPPGLHPRLETANDDDSDDEDNAIINNERSPEGDRESDPDAASVDRDVDESIVRSATSQDYNPPEPQASKDPFSPLDMYDETGIPHRPIQQGKTWIVPRRLEASRSDPGLKSQYRSEAALESLTEITLGPVHCELAPRTNRFVFNSFLKYQFRSRMRSLEFARRMRRPLHRETDAVVSSMGEILDSGRQVSFDPNEGYLGSDRGMDEPLDFLDDSSDDGEHLQDAEQSKSLNTPCSETQVQLIAATYEEACRKYLRESSTLWREQAADSNLVRRVSAWRSRIEPLLEAEEQRPCFDIKLCTTEILASFHTNLRESKSYVSDMAKLFRTNEPFEVCRKFLATLQLANNYTIEILESPFSSQQSQNFIPQLKLLQPALDACDSSSPPGRGTTNVLRSRPVVALNSASEYQTPIRNTMLTSGKRSRSSFAPESASRVHTKLRIDG